MAAGALGHVRHAGVARALGVDAAPVVGDQDAHAAGLALPGHVDVHGGSGRVGVASDIGQAFANDGHDVVGQVGVHAPVELVDDDQLVVQVGVNRISVQRDEQRGGKP